MMTRSCIKQTLIRLKQVEVQTKAKKCLGLRNIPLGFFFCHFGPLGFFSVF